MQGWAVGTDDGSDNAGIASCYVNCPSGPDKTTAQTGALAYGIEGRWNSTLLTPTGPPLWSFPAIHVHLWRNPASNQQPANQQRQFHLQEYGEVDGWPGYWATHEESGQAGFLQAYADTFWTHDGAPDVWATRHVKGRRLTKGSVK